MEIGRSLISFVPRIFLNETRNASSLGFFLKILSSIFQSINMGVDHKSFLQLLLIGFSIFLVKLEKR